MLAKTNGLHNYANEMSKENYWSCYSQDDQWVTSVLNGKLQTTNSSYIATDLDPHVL